MPHLLNALLSVLVVAGLLAGPSLRPGLGLLLGLTGSTIANHFVWLASPSVWSHVAVPWLASVVGALAAVAVWSALRTSPTVAELVGAGVTGAVEGTSGSEDETDGLEGDTGVGAASSTTGTSGERGREPSSTRSPHVRTLGR